jgi:L-fucose isomerase-like protein
VKPLVSHVAVAALSSPLEVGADKAPAAANQLADLLKNTGCRVENAGPVRTPEEAAAAGRLFAEKHVHAVALVCTSWFEDYLAVDLLEECPTPALIWSLPGMETGALCGAQQLTACLRQLNYPYFAIFGPLEPGAVLNRGIEFLQAAALRHALRRAKIGFAGRRVTGMTETAANEFALKKTIGPRVTPLDLPELINRVPQIPDDQADPLWRQMQKRAAACRVSDPDGLDCMKVYLALKDQIARHTLDALTVGCYPHLMGRVCLAASLLADDGVPFACEGDVNGAAAQLILALLTGSPTHHTDWLDPLDDGSVVMTHCGSGSFSLAENPRDITLAPVRLMNQGACALFPAKPGPVTLLNFMPNAAGYQCAMIEAEAIPTSMVFPGNPLRIRLSCPIDKTLDWIHQRGVGHHWAAGYGRVAPVIRHWAEIAGQNLILIEPPR